jgi:hypothetical protein
VVTDRGRVASSAAATGTGERRQAFDAVRAERDGREALRADLSASRRTLGAVLTVRADGPDARTKVLFVLESLPGSSKVLTRRRLGELGVDGNAPLSSLDDATCRLLLENFPLAGGSGS